ncbi:MAG: TonB C-terminal domain-containing protein [Chthoniobacteraceae bacterium]|jgi:periplasmic protein TonB
MFDYDLEEDHGFFWRHRTTFITAGFVVLCAGVFVGARALSRINQRPISHNEVIIAILPTLPPLPKPTPRPTPTPDFTPPEQKQEMVIQNPVQNVPKPPAPKPIAPAAGPIGTSIVGSGVDPFGLGSGLGGGGGYGDGSGSGGGKYAWYASEIQSRIAKAIRDDSRARHVNVSLIVRIWPDQTGRITRAKVSGGSDSGFETTVQNSILAGLQLPDPPPSDMPLPIVMRLSVTESR